jgi:ADP-ribose pyrophosphatase YjhB (NUDIX family)
VTDHRDHGLWPGEFAFCPHCATRLEAADIASLRRMRCPACDFVHYRNPGVGAAAVVFDTAGRLLLVRRGPDSTGAGLWSIPAGFVDYGEDVRAAAARELEEETGLVASIGEPVWVASNFHDPAKLTVGIWFAAAVTGGELAAGSDATEAEFFPLDGLPPLAFDTDKAYLAYLSTH